MKQGGNRQFRLFLESLDIGRAPIEVLYRSKVASLYRAKLRKQVDNILEGKPVGTTISESLELHRRVLVDSRIEATNRPSISRYTVMFPVGVMGMTVSKDPADNRAYISRLVEGGEADQSGVLVGDYVDGVAGKYISDFDIVMHMIPLMPRPVQIMFSRTIRKSTDGLEEDHEGTVYSSPESSPSKSVASSLQHTSSFPDLTVDPETVSNVINDKVPRRKWKNKERASITVLRGDSMMYDSDSDGPEGVSHAFSQPALTFASSPSLMHLSTGMASTKSTPMKSPRLGRHKKFSSNSEEAKSDSESLYNTPSGMTHSAVARRREQPLHDEYEDHLLTLASNTDPKTPAVHECLDNNINNPKPRVEKSGQEIDGVGILASPLVKRRAVSADTESSFEVTDDRSTTVKVDSGHAKTSAYKTPPRGTARNDSSPQTGEYVLRLKRGLCVRVWNASTESWDAGSIHRQHRDGTFKVRFEDGHAEPHVKSDRIAIPRGTLRSLSSFISSFESINSAGSTATGTSIPLSKGEIPSDILPQQGSGDINIDISGHSSCSSKSFNSRTSAREWLDIVKAGRDAESKIEFVVEYPGDDDNDWLGESDQESEQRVPALERNVSNNSERHFSGLNSDASSLGTLSFKVQFLTPPMGFTLNRSSSGHAHVTKIVPGGQASSSPIQLGDWVVDINGVKILGYDDFMKSMRTVQYPAVVTFMRKADNAESVGRTGRDLAYFSVATHGALKGDDVMLSDAYKQLVEVTKATPPSSAISAPSMTARAISAPAASHTTLPTLDQDKSSSLLGVGNVEIRDICFREVCHLIYL